MEAIFIVYLLIFPALSMASLDWRDCCKFNLNYFIYLKRKKIVITLFLPTLKEVFKFL